MSSETEFTDYGNLVTDPTLDRSEAETWAIENGGKLIDVTSARKEKFTEILIKADVPKAWIYSWNGDPQPCSVLNNNGNITPNSCEEKLAFFVLFHKD